MPSRLAAAAGFSCVLSAVSTLAMWDATRTGGVPWITPIAGLGATIVSGVVCYSLLASRR